MEDVSSCRRDLNFDKSVVDRLNFNSHLGSTSSHLVSVKLEPKNSVNVSNLNIEVVVVQSRSDFVSLFIAFVSNLNLFTFVLPFTTTVYRELSSHNSETNLSLLEISSSDFNKDVLSIASDLGCVRVDERRERKYLSVCIEEYGEFIVTIEDREELLHYVISLVELTKLFSGHAFSLLECLEFNFSRRESFVGDRSLNFIQIVSSHGSKLASSADILMKLVLEINERVVRSKSEVDVTEDASNNVRADRLSFRLYNDLLKRVLNALDFVTGKSGLLSKVAAECSSDSF